MPKDNQHFIPKGYLRGFTIPDEKSLIWEYSKSDGEVSRNPKSIAQICAKYQYYAQKDENGNVDKETIENSFYEIEDKTPRIIRKLNVQESTSKIHIDESSRAILSLFAALILTRVPNFRDGVEDFHRKMVELSLANIIEMDRENGRLPDSIDAMWKDGKIKIDIESFVSLRPMFEMAKYGAASLLEKVWWFAAPEKGMQFVTSDNPVYFQAPEKYRGVGMPAIGPFHPISEVSLPLRKDLLLVFSPSVEFTKEQYELLNMRGLSLDKADTDNFNQRTILAAKEFIYSSVKSQEVLAFVKKYRGLHQGVTV